jgi:hypothetical protein
MNVEVGVVENVVVTTNSDFIVPTTGVVRIGERPCVAAVGAEAAADGARPDEVGDVPTRTSLTLEFLGGACEGRRRSDHANNPDYQQYDERHDTRFNTSKWSHDQPPL